MSRPLLPIAISAAGSLFGALLIAGNQSVDQRSSNLDWKIAQRFDSGRVVIMLTEDDANLTMAEEDGLGPSLPKPAADFLSPYLEGVHRLPVELGRRLAKGATTPGDRWALDGGRAGWFSASASDFVLTRDGCSDFVATMVEIDASQAEAFGQVRGKYFAARSMKGWTPPARPTVVGPVTYAVSTGDHALIEQLLQREFARTSSSLLSDAVRNHHGPEAPDTWRNIYARIRAGGGTLRFETQAFRLTPDGFPRLFVQALWTLDGKPAYAMGAWLRTAPALAIEQSDLHAARFAWSELFDEMKPSISGEVLGAFDVDRDGLAEVLMLYHYYEGFSIEASTYPPAEPSAAKVIAKFGAGC